MNKLLLSVAIVIISIAITNAQSSIITFYSADGTDGSNWSYKDYVIPTGFKVDSVYGGFRRPGYSTSDYDWNFEYTPNSSTYSSGNYVSAWIYGNVSTSLYGTWIDVSDSNFMDVGVVRANLPTNAGAIWDSLKIAISPIAQTNCNSFTDPRDGQTYSVVEIGTQMWMGENLNYGTQVANVDAATNNSVVEKACYNNSSGNCDTYGGIYNWNEAMNYTTDEQGICPNGWHIPTKTEWNTLISYLGSSNAGEKMKVTSSNTPSWNGTNTSGFNALPSGVGSGTSFSYLGSRATFWSSTEFNSTNVWDYDLSTSSNALTEAYNTKPAGYCIRCIMDALTTVGDITYNTLSICSGNSVYAEGAYQTTSGIYYDTLQNSSGCDSIIVTTLTVNALPTVSHTALDNSYCSNENSVTLVGSPTGGTFTIDGNTNSLFDPANLSAGSHALVYSYTDGNGCTNTSSQNVSVLAAPSVSFTGLGTSYTVNDAAVQLSGAPSNGLFSGNGVENGMFNPSSAGEGTHSIVYMYVDGNGCMNASGQCTDVSLFVNIDDQNSIANSFDIFPNPNNGQCTISLSTENNATVTLKVFDSTGKLILAETSKSSGTFYQKNLDLTEYAKGAYKITLQTDKQILSKSLVVER